MRELIVADDGDGALASHVPADERIHYVKVPTGCQTLGAKRNFANAQARGDVIAHWDDDDWMAPDRISVQFDALVTSGADICGARDLLYYALYEGQAWRYHYPHKDRAWVAGNTLMYRRQAWAERPFPDQHVGEDSAFVSQFNASEIHAIEAPILVGVIHPLNTAKKNLRDAAWERRPMSEVSGLIADDRSFYAAIRNPSPAGRINSNNQPPKQARAARIASQSPLVSCIMPTYNRRSFVLAAIDYFQRQDYPNRELVIVDDGTDPIGDILPNDPEITYLHMRSRRSTGVKRNLACEAAKGEIIIHWDDDDWYAPTRISYQIDPLLRGDADSTGLGHSLLYELQTSQFWQVTPKLHNQMFQQGIHGGTLAFWKQLWRSGSYYPDTSLAEDVAVQHSLIRRGKRVERLHNNDVFIYMRHGGNTWSFNVGDFIDRDGWERAAPPLFLPAADLAHFRKLRDIDLQ
jgi:O-antigen biosynthesis protein